MKKRQIRKLNLIKTRAIQALVVVLIFFTLYLIISQLQNLTALLSQTSELEDRLQKTNTENEQLEEDITTFSDPEIIDKEARERLNLKKEGENVVVILPNPDEEQGSTTSEEDQDQSQTFWQKIKSWFEI